VDVTARLMENSDLMFTSRWDDPGIWACVITIAKNSPYRLRKQTVHKDRLPMWAFLVERKQP